MIQSVKGNGQGPSGPPDLMELVKKFTGGGPSRGKFGGGVLGVVVLILLVWGALTSFYTVQPEQRAVVK
ncbi:MAG: FtsH protease activity modulator HflK, partial [Pseudomonadota bacterium]|nr:FtsH protease activity modulator HflK [Pseudomonadota bacterium]